MAGDEFEKPIPFHSGHSPDSVADSSKGAFCRYHQRDDKAGPRHNIKRINEPLSPALSPLVPRGERESLRARFGGTDEMRTGLAYHADLACSCPAGSSTTPMARSVRPPLARPAA